MKSSGFNQRVATFAIAAFATCWSFGFAILGAQDALQTEITDTSKAADIPIQLHAAHIFLEVQVNGKGPYAFVLDTGAPFSVVDSRIAAETNIKFSGATTAGGTGANVRAANFANNVNLELAGVRIADRSIVAISMQDFEAILGREIDGIIGIDLFQNFVVEIDYADSRLRVYDNENFHYDDDGIVVPIRIESQICWVDATVKLPGRSPVPGSFKIDTGSNSQLRLNSPFVAEHKMAENLTNAIESKGFGVGGQSLSTLSRIESFEIGGLKFDRPITAMSRAKQGAAASSSAAGIVGGGLLERCNVVFDFKQQRMIVRPNADFDAPFESDMLGIRWMTGGRGNLKSFSVSELRDNSAALKAGIKVGDKLIDVNGIPPEQLSVPKLHELARTHDRIVRFTFERGEETVKCEVKLRREL